MIMACRSLVSQSAVDKLQQLLLCICQCIVHPGEECINHTACMLRLLLRSQPSPAASFIAWLWAFAPLPPACMHRLLWHVLPCRRRAAQRALTSCGTPATMARCRMLRGGSS